MACSTQRVLRLVLNIPLPFFNKAWLPLWFTSGGATSVARFWSRSLGLRLQASSLTPCFTASFRALSTLSGMFFCFGLGALLPGEGILVCDLFRGFFRIFGTFHSESLVRQQSPFQSFASHPQAIFYPR